MKRILILIFGLTMLANASAFEKNIKYKDVNVQLTSEKPLTSGSNTFLIQIKKSKEPVNGKVAVKAFMPAMPGMPAMSSKSKAKFLKNGTYKVKLNFAMTGTWQFHIFIKTKKKKYKIKTNLNF